MTFQWIVIGLLVIMAAVYLFGVIRQTFRRPFCSDCPGCMLKSWKNGKN